MTESDAWFRLLAEQAPDLIYVLDLQLQRPLYCNRDAFLGYPRSTLEQAGALLAEVHPHDLTMVMNSWEQVHAGELTPPIEYRLRSHSGTWEWLQSRTVVIARSVDQRPTQVMVTLTQITAQKRRETALRQIVAGTQATGQAFFDGLVQALAEVLGVRHAFVAEIDLPTAQARSIAVWAGDAPGAPFSYPLAGTPCANVATQDVCFYRTNVQISFPQDDILTELNADSYLGIPLRSSTGNLLGLLAVVHDGPVDETLQPVEVLQIFAARGAAELERMRTEQALVASEEQLRITLAAARIGIWDWDIASSRFAWSGQVDQIFGLPPGSFAATYQAYLALIDPRDRARVEETIAATFATQSAFYQIEHRVIWPDGTVRWAAGQGQVDRNAHGVPTRMRGTMTDVTARKRAEEAQQQSEERFVHVFEASPIGIAISTCPEGRIVEVNPSYRRLTQYIQEDLVDHSILELGLWGDRATQDHITALLREQRPVRDLEFTFHTATGQQRTVLASLEHIEIGGMACVLTMAHDITVRQQAEVALRESEERYRLISDHASDLIALFDQQGKFIYASPSNRHWLGWEPANLLGSSGFAHIHPDDMAHVVLAFEEMRSQGTARFACRCQHANGSWHSFETSVAVTMWQGLPCVVSVGRDVTERKRLEAQLLQVQKMDSIGRLAGGIAHDFNNLLTAIRGYTDFALMSLPADHVATADLQAVHEATTRAAGLTHQLLAFARKQIINVRVLQLNTVLHDIERLLRRLIGEDIVLVTQPDPELGLVKVDPGQLEQVVVNLAVNARDAMPRGGTLTIATRNIVLSEPITIRHMNVVPGPYVILTVSDTGVGISTVLQDQVFEPFFTTKGPGHGTGLGLATSDGIVQQHGGYIGVTSADGQGTTFTIYLPRVEASMVEATPPPTLAALPTGRETILVVEDEPAVRVMTVRILRAQGYTVIEAMDGPMAREVALAYSGTIDLLLTDVVLPQLNGRGVADQLLQFLPELNVLFMSGYTDTGIVQDGRLDEGLQFLHKPFTPASLARKVRAVLDARTRGVPSVGEQG